MGVFQRAVRASFKRFYPNQSHRPGYHDWSDGWVTIDYAVPAGDDPFQDKLFASFTTPSGKVWDQTVKGQSVAPRAGPNLNPINLRELKWNILAGSFETTATATRVPGTRATPAKFKGVQYRIFTERENGVIGPFSPINWTTADLSITVCRSDCNKDQRHETFESPFNSNLQAIGARHCRIAPAPGGTLLLWDRYDWPKKLGEQW